MTFEAAAKALTDHFLPDSNLHVGRTVFHSIRLAEFSNLNEMYAYILKTYPTLKIAETEALQVFINALPSLLKEHCILQQPATLARAYECTQLKLASTAAIKSQQVTPAVSMLSNATLENKIDFLCEEIEKMRTRSKTCYNCGKGGHIARNCFGKFQMSQEQDNFESNPPVHRYPTPSNNFDPRRPVPQQRYFNSSPQSPINQSQSPTNFQQPVTQHFNNRSPRQNSSSNSTPGVRFDSSVNTISPLVYRNESLPSMILRISLFGRDFLCF